MHIFFRIVDGDDTALGTEKGFMGGSGHDIGAFLEGLLEIRSDQTQNMGHVVHQQAIQFQFVKYCTDFADRFTVNDHALAQDNQLRPMLLNQFAGGGHIYFVRVVRQHRKINYRRFLPFWIAHNKIP